MFISYGTIACINQVQAKYLGSLNLTKIRKQPGQFYRWTTDGSVWVVFQKTDGIFGACPMPQIPPPPFFLTFYI